MYIIFQGKSFEAGNQFLSINYGSLRYMKRIQLDLGIRA